MNHKLLLAAFFLGLTICASAKRFDNPCGVVSRFTPNNDSTVALNSNFIFTSQSTNATSFTWYINGYYWGNTTTQYINFGVPGSYEIMLVARNGTCYDTSFCYYIVPGTQPANRDNTKAFYGFPNTDELVTGLASCNDGGFLIAGSTSLYKRIPPPYHLESGLLIKTSESGCVEWTKVLKSTTVGTINYVFSFPDTTYGIIGYDDGSFVRVLDAAGNEKWNRNFYSHTNNAFSMRSMAQCADKGYIMVSSDISGVLVAKLDSNGNLLWSRHHYKTSNQNLYYIRPSVLVQGNDIYIMTTSYESAYMTTSVSHAVVLKLDAATGNSRWAKMYKINGNDVSTLNLASRGTGLLLNTTVANGDNNIMYLDTAGNIVDSRTILAPGLNASIASSSVQVRANGDLYVFNQGSSPLTLQPYITYKANFTRLDKNFNLKWSYHYGGAGRGRFYYHAVSTKGIFGSIGEEYSYGIPAYTVGAKIMLKKFDTAGSYGPAFNCNFTTTNINITSSPASVQDLIGARDSAYPITLGDTGTALLTHYAHVRYVCPTEFIDSCSFLKVTGTGAVCNLSNTYTYRIHKNKTCNQPVQWQVSPAANILSQSDTAITIRFTSFGNYSVAALLPYSCTPVKDSVLVTVASRSPVLSLGADTSLCPGNTMTANAGPGFLTYLWQDGSTLRTLSITAPGIYWVKATDSCGNIFSDTLLVSAANAVAINAGPDRSKCNNDTLHLTAPAGYTQYQWTPNYQISATNTAAVIINPLVDTTYYLRAEKTPGCFAFDTIHVQVHRSPVIQLGNDTSICSGAAVVLNAGPGFANYQWSNNANTPQISINTAGNYSIIATDNFGCRSTDTFKLISIYPLPIVRLQKDSLLCIGNKLTLDAGAGFASYSWSTGSTTQTIEANSVGNYKVAVTDVHGCIGTDSSRITRILPLPAGFLPADVQICSYDKATLQPTVAFNQYLWSNGSASSTITVATPGRYWLKATDRYNCAGYDTMSVTLKECIRGIYFPSAFTPDGDGRNDVFKPILFGGVMKYVFTIYNRWGQQIFTTTDTGKGWDGKIAGTGPAAGVYTWFCTYQLEGQPVKQEKGTVVVIH